LRVQFRGQGSYDIQDHSCSLAIASAHSCAALHIQRWRPNGWTDRDPIGTNTHWGNRHNLLKSVIASAHSCARCSHKRAHSTTYPVLAPTRLDWSRPQLVQILIGVIGTSYWSWRVQSARHARNYGSAVVPRKRKVGELARSARVHEWNMAVQTPRARGAFNIVERCAQKLKKVAESQRVHEWNMP
jgi:hypothetical protein